LYKVVMPTHLNLETDMRKTDPLNERLFYVIGEQGRLHGPYNAHEVAALVCQKKLAADHKIACLGTTMKISLFLERYKAELKRSLQRKSRNPTTLEYDSKDMANYARLVKLRQVEQQQKWFRGWFGRSDTLATASPY
jgi:hypothetical protein